MTHPYLIIASTYGAGTYNANNYNGTNTSTSTGAETGGNLLVNTGIAIAGIVTIATVVLLVAMVVRVWRRPGKKVQAVSVEPNDSAKE